MQYVTKDGEKLDLICFDNYGFVNNSFEMVLYDPVNYDRTTKEIFSAGDDIELPVIEPEQAQTETMIWE